MIYGPVTKLDKRNKKPLKKFDYDVMWVNCEQCRSRIPDV